jgi:cytidylate kinase
MKSESLFSVVAIDGPAASGKSSVARFLARRLNFSYVNSGALYRALTWQANLLRIPADDRSAIVALLRQSSFEFCLKEKESFLLVDGADPASHLQEEIVNRTVSVISTIPEIREFVVHHLRGFLALDNLVMEGRDIGSVVFPHTPYKFYVDASPEIRAKRRAAQGLQDEISRRDQLDTTRLTAPLAIAQDAVLIDTSSLSIEEVANKIFENVKNRILPGIVPS